MDPFGGQTFFLRSQREDEGPPDFLQPFPCQRGDDAANLHFADGLDVIKIDRTLFRHTVRLSQNDFRGNIADGCGDGSNGGFRKEIYSRVTRKSYNWPPLVRSGELVPSHFAPIHLVTPFLFRVPDIELPAFNGMLLVTCTIFGLQFATPQVR